MEVRMMQTDKLTGKEMNNKRKEKDIEQKKRRKKTVKESHLNERKRKIEVDKVNDMHAKHKFNLP